MGRHGTIAGRKAAQDNKRAAIFTKYARAIIVAAKSGADPDYNASLKNAIDKAKSINMPKDRIEQAVKKGSGQLEGESYETASFEGYGPSGVAVIVDVLTDNKNRTTSAVKSAFDKHGGNLGVPGCVSYMFERKGVILIEKGDGVDEDSIMETALDAGIEDILDSDEFWEVRTSPEDFLAAAEALRGAGYELAESDIEYVPSMEAEPKNESDKKALIKMIDILEDNDDVQKVYTNCSADLS
ncbi:MAG: YebC/PmpR family DNA-binding transcriptional regulator [Clostridiales Family XIII bacterium]|jgi:YebC/PmpR family DNA-binding regulatory protein|nr:YebC/PmpR family DNA-binding transcriptional regulator [Clostridiales Family XIII bacterium]